MHYQALSRASFSHNPDMPRTLFFHRWSTIHIGMTEDGAIANQYVSI